MLQRSLKYCRNSKQRITSPQAGCFARIPSNISFTPTLSPPFCRAYALFFKYGINLFIEIENLA
jgi:hypothetical protein